MKKILVILLLGSVSGCATYNDLSRGEKALFWSGMIVTSIALSTESGKNDGTTSVSQRNNCYRVGPEGQIKAQFC